MKTKFIALVTLLVTVLTASAAEGKGDGFRPLFNGKDLTGWKLRNPSGHNSWTIEPGGILKNTVEKGGPHGNDLLTEQTFRDFTVRYEYMTPDNSNSGFYLRGRQEIQIIGDYKKGESDKTGNGAIYNFKAPDKFVTKPAGQWQTAEVTIVGNRITVILNGVKIHDNVECDHATGGELDNKMDQPGPILLQGDHGTVSFRNIQIRNG
jgi:hypothetical protein